MFDPDYGLTKRKVVSMTRRAVKKRWRVSSETRKRMIKFCEEVMDDESVHVSNRLKAVDSLVRMEAMNQVDERIQIEVDLRNGNYDAQSGNAGKVIVLLPPNGTEAHENSVSERGEDGQSCLDHHQGG